MEMIKKDKFWPVIALVLGLLILLGIARFVSGGYREGMVNSRNQGIMVSGEGSLTVKPDIAQAVLGIETEAATAGAAQQKNSEVMNKIIADIKGLGIEEKDIQTSNYNLYPDRQVVKGTTQEQLVGYRATNQVTVTLHDLNKLGPAIDEAILSGANNINSINFSVESPDRWRNKAIAKAVKDARIKAEVMAKAAGVRIKRVLSITDVMVDVRSYQMDAQKELFMSGSRAETPIEPGNVKVTANIQMGFGI